MRVPGWTSALALGSLLAVGVPSQPASRAPAFDGEDFIVDDVVVSNRKVSLVDVEFDKLGFRMAWRDSDGRLWVSDIDPETGAWTPKSGRGQLVDKGLPQGVNQGPEWAYAAGGARIVYTKEVYGIPHLYQAALENGRWRVTRLRDSSFRSVVKGSKDSEDGRPRVAYEFADPQRANLRGWREIDDPDTDQVIPAQHPGATSWVEGRRSIILTVEVDGVDQVAEYEVDTGVLTQLTFDAVSKRFPLMWSDPALGGEYVLTSVLNETEIGVFRHVEGSWVLAGTLRPPSAYPYVYKTDYFVRNGTSYLSYLATTEKDGRVQSHRGQAEVWVSQVRHDGGPTFHRRVNNPSITRIKDPENLVTPGAVYIYYVEITRDGTRIVHRCDAGL